MISCCVHELKKGNNPNLFDNWADTSLHLLLLKSSMVDLLPGGRGIGEPITPTRGDYKSVESRSTLVEGDEQPYYPHCKATQFSFVSAVSGLFLKLIDHGASTVVHLLLLKFSMVECVLTMVLVGQVVVVLLARLPEVVNSFRDLGLGVVAVGDGHDRRNDKDQVYKNFGHSVRATVFSLELNGTSHVTSSSSSSGEKMTTHDLEIAL